jgi:ElaB/YqjD/DUF883 family membrane-anchored ribosome-binding protein
MSDTPSTSSTDKSPNLGTGMGQGTAGGAAREPRGFAPGSTAQGQSKDQIDKAARTARSAVDQAGTAFSSGMDNAQARMQDIQDWASQQQDTARERIREHPLTSMAITFGAGMLFGMLMARR